MKRSSHREIFKSSAIIGSASAVIIVIGIVKVKFLAVLLGPAGIGLMGLYQNIMSMSATLASCGVDNSGVRQLAASASEQEMLAIVRRSLWFGNLLLGLLGMLILWTLREPVAVWVFGDASNVVDVGWIGIGVLLTLVAGSQTALLQGLRRISDLALVRIVSALVGAVLGIVLIWSLGDDGVLWFVLAAPGASVLIAGYVARRLPRPQTDCDWEAIARQWVAMLKLGIPFMFAGLLMLATQLVVRSLILRELGLEATGHFQAAWAISMTYIGFVLGAMSADYYPRLTAVIHDHPRANQLVSEQAEMALLLAGPVLLAMITLAPWVIHLLYADSFSPAIEVLRWQILGDILKVASWPMGFILLAKGRGGLFIVTEFTWSIVYLGSVYVGIQHLGLLASGIAFLLAYLVGSIVVVSLASRLIGYVLYRKNVVFTTLLLLAGMIISSLFVIHPVISYVVGGLSTITVGAYSFRQLDKLIDLHGWVARLYQKRNG